MLIFEPIQQSLVLQEKRTLIIMKKIILLGAVVSSCSLAAQTNRINHFSHSGTHATLNFFTANDNMGLGCGSVYNAELKPYEDTTTVFLDSVALDSAKVCTPKPPMDGMKSIYPKPDTSRVYNRGPK